MPSFLSRGTLCNCTIWGSLVLICSLSQKRTGVRSILLGFETQRYAADTRKLEKVDKPFEINGAGGGNRTHGLGIMSSPMPADPKEDSTLKSAENGQVRQNPQLGRNQKSDEGDQ